MRAMSLGLVKGSIDEISQSTSITWVQPRHMDMVQVGQLRTQLDSWAQRYCLYPSLFLNLVEI